MPHAPAQVADTGRRVAPHTPASIAGHTSRFQTWRLASDLVRVGVPYAQVYGRSRREVLVLYTQHFDRIMKVCYG